MSSSPLEDTPAHLTDIRFVKPVVSHDVFQRFRLRIDKNINLCGESHDRFQAVERNIGAICSVSVEGKNGPDSGAVWTLHKPRTLRFKVKRQILESGRLVVMSRAIMNKYNLGVRK